MYRVEQNIHITDLDRIATNRALKLCWARARCQHGKTREQPCMSCEQGYVDDTHIFALLRAAPATFLAGPHKGEDAIAITDDGSDVGYIPRSHQDQLNRASST